MTNVRCFACFFIFLGIALSQDIPVLIKGKGPKLNNTVTTKINYKAALVTFSLGNAEIDGIGAAEIPISITNKTGQFPAGVQFELSWNPSDISGVNLALGTAAAAAQKSLTCNAISASVMRCIIIGTPSAGAQTGIADGVVAIATFQTNLTSQSVTTVSLLNNVSASIQGKSINTVTAAGGGIIQMPALLASVSCSQEDIWFELQVNCTAALNKPAPAGGISLTFETDSTLVTVSPSLIFTQGEISKNFTVTGN